MCFTVLLQKEDGPGWETRTERLAREADPADLAAAEEEDSELHHRASGRGS